MLPRLRLGTVKPQLAVGGTALAGFTTLPKSGSTPVFAARSLRKGGRCGKRNSEFIRPERTRTGWPREPPWVSTIANTIDAKCPSFLGSFTERGLVCKWLIGINIICFLLQIVTGVTTPGGTRDGPFTDALLLNIDKVMNGEVWRLLTYGFLHSPDKILHIVFNMLLLYWFGQQIEERLGSREFLAFYLAGIVVAGLAYLALRPCSIGTSREPPPCGASGGVMAVLVLAAIYNPRQIIYLFFLIPVPIWAVVVFMVVWDAIPFLRGTKTEIAVTAHLGGAAFGFAYYKPGPTNHLPAAVPVRVGLRKRAKPRLRLYREEEDEQAIATAVPAARHAPVRMEDEQLEAQMDAILAKIPRVGMEGLTESERQLLLRASEAIKRRRG